MKKLFSLIICSIIFNTALGASACVYNPSGFTFHCSNNMPGSQIIPGQEGVITVRCCFTEERFLNSDEELPVIVEVKDDWFHRVQNPDGSWNEVNQTYPASQFITNVEYPNSSKGFEEFSVIIHYSLPSESNLYLAGESISSRVDVKIILGGSIINNAIYPQIRIPDDWTGTNNFSSITLISGLVTIILVSSLVLSVARKRRKKKRMRKAQRVNDNNRIE